MKSAESTGSVRAPASTTLPSSFCSKHSQGLLSSREVDVLTHASSVIRMTVSATGAGVVLSGRSCEAGANPGDTFLPAAARCCSLKGPRFSKMSGTYLYCSTWYVGAALACVVCIKQQDQKRRATQKAFALCGSFSACECLEILTFSPNHCGMRGDHLTLHDHVTEH